jgi:hypothetical protein
MKSLFVILLLSGCSLHANGFAKIPGADGSAYGTDGGGGSDSGLPDNLPPNTLFARLDQPAPFSSLVQTGTPLVFTVAPGGATQAQVESWIRVVKSGTATPITGGYLWSPIASWAWQVTFLPSAPLDDNADWLVRADDPRAAPPAVLRTAFSTGSHPRVIRVELTATQASIAFSEPMIPSTLAQLVSVLQGGAPVAGSLGPDPAAPQDASRCAFAFSHSIAGPAADVAVRIAPGAQSASMTPLDPLAWSSPTQMSGAFLLDLGSIPLNNFSDVVWEPTVN